MLGTLGVCRPDFRARAISIACLYSESVHFPIIDWQMSASASHLDIHIRGAEPGEVDYLLNSIRLDAVVGTSRFPVRTVKRHEADHLNTQHPVTILVALASQVRVGYVFFTLESHFLDDSTGAGYACAEITQLFVLKDWHGQGIGQRVLNAALQRIWSQRYPTDQSVRIHRRCFPLRKSRFPNSLCRQQRSECHVTADLVPRRADMDRLTDSGRSALSGRVPLIGLGITRQGSSKARAGS